MITLRPSEVFVPLRLNIYFRPKFDRLTDQVIDCLIVCTRVRVCVRDMT